MELECELVEVQLVQVAEFVLVDVRMMFDWESYGSCKSWLLWCSLLRARRFRSIIFYSWWELRYSAIKKPIFYNYHLLERLWWWNLMEVKFIRAARCSYETLVMMYTNFKTVWNFTRDCFWTSVHESVAIFYGSCIRFCISSIQCTPFSFDTHIARWNYIWHILNNLVSFFLYVNQSLG